MEKTAYFPLTVAHKWRCFTCGKDEFVTVNYWLEQPIMAPSLPGGWVRIGAVVVCREHELLFLADGKNIFREKEIAAKVKFVGSHGAIE